MASKPYKGLKERLEKGDQEVLYLVYHIAYKLLRRINPRGIDVESVLQEAVLKAWENASSYDPSRNFSPWINAITHNVLVSAYRKESRHKEIVNRSLDAEIMGKEGDHVRLSDLIEGRDLTDKIPELGSFESLYVGVTNPEEEKVIELRYGRGKSMEETARILEIPMGTVKSRSHSAMNEVRGFNSLTDVDMQVA